jgi:hypothetical protein
MILHTRGRDSIGRSLLGRVVFEELLAILTERESP